MKKNMHIYIIAIIIIIILLLLITVIKVIDKTHIEKTIYVASMTPQEMEAGLKDGTIAGFISWEPYPAKTVSEGYGRYLVNSSEIWENHPCCVLAISDNIKDEDMIRALVWMQIKSTRFINDPINWNTIVNYGSDFTGVDKTAMSIAINNTEFLEFPDVDETRKVFSHISSLKYFLTFASRFLYVP
jgi:NitT/TauT family transport system substrate-binding protein